MPDAPVERALVSVSDKAGLVELGRFLAERGVEILSTGGSAKALSEAGVAVTEVARHTGFPEILDGRVKTLHPLIHGGLLGRRDDPDHRAAMAQHGIAPIDLLVVNLYPFAQTVAAGGDPETCIETIDIGGPALIRAAAKNHAHVAVLTAPDQYAEAMAEMDAHGGAISRALRSRLAARAFAHTAAYDAAIADWLAGRLDEGLPERMTLAGRRASLLRYGENPHQEAALYVGGTPRPGVATAHQVQGKALSYNNLNDTDAAFECVAEVSETGSGRAAIVIVKHANPCGVAVADSLSAAYRRAFACDPVSAFGGIVAADRALDAKTAREIAKVFTEVVIAPDADAEARAILAQKTGLRLLLTGGLPEPTAPGRAVTSISGGYLVQSRDAGRIAQPDLRVVTRRAPDARELDDLLFAFRVAKHVKSNAIVYARDGATVGVGAGQMSRVDSARIAVWKAEAAARAANETDPRTKGAVVASDAFFPFADGLLAAAEAGCSAVIQPGGSVRDEEVIAAADEAGLAMVFTGMRHFRH